MDADGRVAQNGLGTGGGDGEEGVGSATRHHVFEVKELAVFGVVGWCLVCWLDGGERCEGSGWAKAREGDCACMCRWWMNTFTHIYTHGCIKTNIYTTIIHTKHTYIRKPTHPSSTSWYSTSRSDTAVPSFGDQFTR